MTLPRAPRLPSRPIAPIALGAAVLIGAIAACTADDPVLGNVGARTNDAGASGGGGDAIAPSDSDASSSGDAAAPVVVDPRCPKPVAYLPCDGAAVAYGAPALRLDACTVTGDEGDRPTWLAETGQILEGSPGALYCRGGLAGRPAMVFDQHGFTLPSASASALDVSSATFAVVAVLRYTPGPRPESASAGVVFQRTETFYPFEGPLLAGNVIFQSTGAPVQTTRLGGSLRYGTDPRGAGGPTAPQAAYAVGSQGPITKPVVVTLRGSPGTLTLRIDGDVVDTYALPAGFSGYGSSRSVTVGRNGTSTNTYFLGAISELLFYASDVPDAQLVALEGALEQKWGIQ